ncbi:MAG: hypothetical protein AABX52_04645 [Nanoarchaeota archaeon]
MVRESVFGGIIDFFIKIGIYDVVLPFLLVFTIVFAILEKTRILGTVSVKGEKYPNKNLNSMTAFVISFLVIASAQLVEIITTVSSQVVILLMLSILFLLLIGSFYKEGEDVALQGGWRTAFVWIMFIGVVLIFLNAIKFEGTRESWLEYGLDYLAKQWSSTAVASLILIIGIILFMRWITEEPAPKSEEKKA